MSINGIPGTYSPAVQGLGGVRPGAGAPSDSEAIRTPRPAPPVQAPAVASRSASAVPVEAPAGTDPELWSVLSAEERTFFARARSMGPVTYAPGSREPSLSGALIGGRLDVRV